MIAKIVLLCAALAAVRASAILNTHLINTGVSASSRQQDVSSWQLCFGYQIKDKLGATNSIRSRRRIWQQERILHP
ncbi:hypothetical protein CEXT_148401 [Caerostris extrusa]|uniref:Uncharacterized protein n=1 Tax=Caerostris extrusa TaxID=172846 RepID=A0AAV4V863_CAEEX|nr:hypothetical protein CEXT_148401 [Caerostris extrusa]